MKNAPVSASYQAEINLPPLSVAQVSPAIIVISIKDLDALAIMKTDSYRGFY